MSAVAFDGVRLSLGRHVVLDAASFAVEPGEFVGVLGPNGAGKTTLLRAVLGLVRPARGRIRVLGGPAAAGHAGIGYMPQHRAAPAPHLVGRDVVAACAGGGRWGLPLLSRAERADVDRALDLVEATALAARPLGQLSGGERQRLLLAQALLGRPRLLLLDEPLASLDPHHQRAVVTLVRRVQQATGVAVLFSAHELNPLLGAMDRVLYLAGGQAAIGTVPQVITGPVLSRLYGTPIEVLRIGGHLLVTADGVPVDQDPHRHQAHA